MKKIIGILILAILYLQKYDFVDITQYETKSIQVEIKGEVKRPDVYTLPVKTTIKQLIKKAKGVNKDADTSSVNLNHILMDGDVIVIGKKTVEKKISINSATIEQLTTLPGIGEAMANRIIEYRKINTFRMIEDIMLVKGIKAKLFSKIKDRISL